MGGGSKTTQTSSGTSEVQLPAWMTQAGQQLYGDASKAAAANPIQGYGGPLTTPTNANQQGASAIAAGGVGAGRADLGAARQLTGAAATGQVDRMQGGTFDNNAAAQYRNPFTEQVQGRTILEMMRQNQMQQQDLGDNVAAGRAYGGTRHAVMEAELGKGQNANILDYLARSNADSYSDAQGQFERDRSARLTAEGTNISSQQNTLDRLLRAGGQAQSIGAQDQGMQTQSILDLLRTGGVQQETDRDNNQALYQEFLRMQDAPLDRYRDLAGILSGTPRNVTTTQSGTQTSKQGTNWLNTILGGAQIAASAGAFSDPRLKRDIKRVDTLENGIGIYSFKYLWDKSVEHIGAMADEVAAIMPDALGPEAFGFQTVNYEKVMA